MTLPVYPNTITMVMVADELGISATSLNLNDSRVRALAGRIGDSTYIEFGHLHGKTFGVGYFGGGYGDITYASEIDGIVFASGSATNPAATLAVARHSLAGVNSGT